MKNRKLKVGFDLYGVILYNPARIIRPIISFVKRKKIVIKRDHLHFYYPKSDWEKSLWRLFHKSSIFQAKGLADIKRLVDEDKIEAYIITARFGYLQKDFNDWLKKIKADQIFKKCYLNEKNEQPHLFKKKMINELNLDVFVEDNWDIVKYLHNNKKTKALWIYNIFDLKINYPYKYSNLSAAVKHIVEMISEKKTK